VIRKEFVVRSLSSNVHMTAVQFTRPFAYSSSTWVSTDDADHQSCDKDVLPFVPAADVDPTAAAAAPGNWSLAGVRPEADETLVMVTTRSARAPYQYVVKSADDPPHMKLTIPGTCRIVISCIYAWPHFGVFRPYGRTAPHKFRGPTF